MMELSGVRNSWLICARNSDLERLANSAWFLASIRARSARLRSLMSWREPAMRTARPRSSRRTNPRFRSQTHSPSASRL